MDEIALRVCPKTQISIEIKAPTMPIAAKDSVALISIFPTIAKSVMDRIGSDTPAINAGIARRLIFLRLMIDFTGYIRSSKKDVRFVLEKR